jgi:predicted nucleotidyltransferase
MPNLNHLKSKLPLILSNFPEIEAAFLFGSIAEGRARKDSDIDLALVPCGDGLPKLKLEIVTALAKAGIDNVDLVILDVEDVVLRYEAIRPNCLVYAKDSFDRGEYYSRRLREYLDFQPILTIQRKAYKRRLERGQA